MLIQLVEDSLFFFMIVDLIEVAGFDDSDTQIFIIRNKKLLQFINVDLILVYMQVTQIEAFKFEDVSVECINQISDLFVAFISFCDVISEQMVCIELMGLIEVRSEIFIV